MTCNNKTQSKNSRNTKINFDNNTNIQNNNNFKNKNSSNPKINFNNKTKIQNNNKQ